MLNRCFPAILPTIPFIPNFSRSDFSLIPPRWGRGRPGAEAPSSPVILTLLPTDAILFHLFKIFGRRRGKRENPIFHWVPKSTPFPGSYCNAFPLFSEFLGCFPIFLGVTGMFFPLFWEFLGLFPHLPGGFWDVFLPPQPKPHLVLDPNLLLPLISGVPSHALLPFPARITPPNPTLG